MSCIIICMAYIVIVHVTVCPFRFRGSKFMPEIQICLLFVLQQVFRVKKLVGLPPQLELLAQALN